MQHLSTQSGVVFILFYITLRVSGNFQVQGDRYFDSAGQGGISDTTWRFSLTECTLQADFKSNCVVFYLF